MFQVSRFRVAFSCLAQVGQENQCLFRRCAMKWTYTLRLCLPRTSSASRSMSSVHLLLLGKIRTSDFVRNVITNLFLFFFSKCFSEVVGKNIFPHKTKLKILHASFKDFICGNSLEFALGLEVSQMGLKITDGVLVWDQLILLDLFSAIWSMLLKHDYFKSLPITWHNKTFQVLWRVWSKVKKHIQRSRRKVNIWYDRVRIQFLNLTRKEPFYETIFHFQSSKHYCHGWHRLHVCKSWQNSKRGFTSPCFYSVDPDGWNSFSRFSRAKKISLLPFLLHLSQLVSVYKMPHITYYLLLFYKNKILVQWSYPLILFSI